MTRISLAQAASKICQSAISIKHIAALLGDTENMVIKVYNHMILEKEDLDGALKNALDF